MSSPIDAVIPALMLLFGLMCAAYVVDAWRLIQRLRNQHRVLWKELGEPSTADLFVYNMSWNFPGRPSANANIQRWLYASEYRELSDPVTTKLAGRLKALKVMNWVVLAFIGAALAMARGR